MDGSIHIAPSSAHRRTIAQQAKLCGVSAEIHPQDHIFNFIASHPAFPTDESRIAYYFQDGAKSARQLSGLLAKHLSIARKPTVLEFACGYGCVTRHLIQNGAIDLISCDIHPEATDFLRSKLRTEAFLSSSVPETLAHSNTYDAVFALSFFSHMPVTTWARWLVRLTRFVAPGGLLIFTCHGNLSKPLLGNPNVDEGGFWYKNSSEQVDLSTEDYGLTITTPEFVRKNINSIPWMDITEAVEGYWWEHQDLYILRKEVPDIY